MGRFYLDVEYTNGNYYLADIIEIALVAEESGHVFHSFVKIHYSVPRQVQELTNITDNIVRTVGLPFSVVMNGFIDFLCREQAQSITKPMMVAHGGYLHDFPILLVNCMKNNVDYTPLAKCTFIDSMQLMQDEGCSRPGLDALCQRLHIYSARHSAHEDAEVLKTICNMYPSILDHPYGYTLQDILHHLNTKQPISIQNVYRLATDCLSYQELQDVLYKYVSKKTALNSKQVGKIAYSYFKDRFRFVCKHT